MQNRKYFFFDIDGTLLVGEPGSQHLPESTRVALEQLRANGHFIAIATGRSAAMATPLMRELSMTNMVHDGGYGLTVNNQLIEIKPLDKEKCLALIEECDAKGIPWAFSPENVPDRLAPDDRFEEATRDTYLHTTTVPGLDPKAAPMIYKMYIACEYPTEHTLEALKALPWCRYGSRYFFVEPVDKSLGIRRMLEYLNADPKDVVVFGDGGNDLSMFDPEWTSIAMGNAVPELKAKADYVTDACWDDGIYNACKHFQWI